MTLATLNDIFFAATERNLDRMMLYRESGKWLPISSSDLHRNVAGTVHALQEWGIRKGDRVAILSENRPEWSTADFAILLLGAVTVPVYSTLTPEQTAYTLRDSGASVVFVSTEHQLRKIQAILSPNASSRKSWSWIASKFPAIWLQPASLMDQFMAQGPPTLDSQTESFARSIQPDDLATIIYTSGTTGTSKGAMLTHGNMASNIACSLLGFDMRPGLTSISFLPLSHVTARHVDFAMLYHGVTLAYCPFMEHLSETLLEVRPTVCVSVPRVYEKIYAKTEMSARGFPKRAIYRWALSVGRANKPVILAGKTPTSPSWKLANKLVFSKIRAGMGGNVQDFHLRRRASRSRTRRVVCHRRHPHSRRLWPDRNFSGDRRQHARQPSHRHRRQGPAQPRSSHRRRRRDSGPRTVRLQGILEPPRRNAERLSGRLVQDRRHRPHRRRWISLGHRPQERTDKNLRRKVHRPATHRESPSN